MALERCPVKVNLLGFLAGHELASSTSMVEMVMVVVVMMHGNDEGDDDGGGGGDDDGGGGGNGGGGGGNGGGGGGDGMYRSIEDLEEVSSCSYIHQVELSLFICNSPVATTQQYLGLGHWHTLGRRLDRFDYLSRPVQIQTHNNIARTNSHYGKTCLTSATCISLKRLIHTHTLSRVCVHSQH